MGRAGAALGVEEQWVPDPLMTDAEFRHQKAVALERTAVDGRDRRHVGEVLASVNLRTVLGGFYRFRGTTAQQQAARRYRNLVETATIGGAKAIDHTIEPVDGRGSMREPMEIGTDARRSLFEARTMLGRHDQRRWDYVVLGDHAPTAYALKFLHACDGRNIKRGEEEVRKIADRLAAHWKLQARA
jgi:hypothetical protein